MFFAHSQSVAYNCAIFSPTSFELYFWAEYFLPMAPLVHLPSLVPFQILDRTTNDSELCLFKKTSSVTRTKSYASGVSYESLTEKNTIVLFLKEGNHWFDIFCASL